jgi:hypothetical protein
MLLVSVVLPPTPIAQGKSSSAGLLIVGFNVVSMRALIVVVVNPSILLFGMKRYNLHDASSFGNFPGEEETLVCPGRGLSCQKFA